MARAKKVTARALVGLVNDLSDQQLDHLTRSENRPAIAWFIDVLTRELPSPVFYNLLVQDKIPAIITVDRSKSFDLAEVLEGGYTVWRGPVNGDGLTGEEEHDLCALALTEIDLHAVHTFHWLEKLAQDPYYKLAWIK